MNITSFAKKIELNEKSEIEKVLLIAFFKYQTDALIEFSLTDILACFEDLHFHVPNKSRLQKNVGKSKDFVKGRGIGIWKLHASALKKLQEAFPDISTKSEEVESTDSIIPESVYENTRGFVEKLSKQINASYDNCIFDGCAILMRKLSEILLIQCYENHKIEAEIFDINGQCMSLDAIIKNAKNNSHLRLTKDAKDSLDEIRSFGNYSAHKTYYNCRRKDLEPIIRKYRIMIEELFYISGLKQ